MRIAIAGAGVGGMAAAALLADRGFDVEIFDQLHEPAPVGSGLIIQPVGQLVLDQIGVADQAVARGNRLVRMLGHEATSGRRVLDVRYDPSGTGQQFGLAIHRATLFDQLWQAVQSRGIPVHVDHRVTGFAPGPDGGRLVFAEQPDSEPFDLVVDALGVNSTLSPMRPRPLAFGALWGIVGWPEGSTLPMDHLNQVYRRADKMIGVMGCGLLPGETEQKATLFWSLPSDSYPSWREAGLERWRAELIGLWPEVEPFVAQITSPDDLTLATYSHGSLRVPVAPGLVHIGDSAHRASPQLGQGANMAMLDALALARALERQPNQSGVAAYARARRWHVRAYQVASLVLTPMFQSSSRVLPLARDRVLFPLSMVRPAPWALSHVVGGTMLPTGAAPAQKTLSR